MRRRITKADLEAMLTCSEEWVEFWERQALKRRLYPENYEMPVPASFRVRP